MTQQKMYNPGSMEKQMLEHAALAEAAARGDAQSMILLAQRYENGVIVQKDEARAILWYLRAKEAGGIVDDEHLAQLKWDNGYGDYYPHRNSQQNEVTRLTLQERDLVPSPDLYPGKTTEGGQRAKDHIFKRKIKMVIQIAVCLVLLVLMIRPFITNGGFYKIRTAEVGHSISLGRYRGSTLNWDVVEDDGDSIVLVCHTIVDCQPFCNSAVETTWEDSDLRTWLNTEFVEGAFSNSIQKRLTWSILDNTGSGESNLEQVETADLVYLLSDEDLARYGTQLYRTEPTDYVKKQYSESVYTYFWLRTMKTEQDPELADAKGNIINISYGTTGEAGVRPVIRVSKALIKFTADKVPEGYEVSYASASGNKSASEDGQDGNGSDANGQESAGTETQAFNGQNNQDGTGQNSTETANQASNSQADQATGSEEAAGSAAGTASDSTASSNTATGAGDPCSIKITTENDADMWSMYVNLIDKDGKAVSSHENSFHDYGESTERFSMGYYLNDDSVDQHLAVYRISQDTIISVSVYGAGPAGANDARVQLNLHVLQFSYDTGFVELNYGTACNESGKTIYRINYEETTEEQFRSVFAEYGIDFEEVTMKAGEKSLSILKEKTNRECFISYNSGETIPDLN